MTASRGLQDWGDIPFFRGLTFEELSKLRPYLRQKTFPANTPIMIAEQVGEIVYIILSGTVKVHVEQADGSDVILSILGPGDIVGEMSLLDNAGRSAGVVTLDEIAVLWMDRAAFRECLRSLTTLTRNLACILSSRLRMANERIQTLAASDIEGRIARQLIAFGERYGEVAAGGDIFIPIRLTQSDIASLVGASRERVNQIMVSYKTRRYISVDRNCRVTIQNQKALVSRCL